MTLLVVASALLVAGHLLPGLDGTFIEFGMRNSLHVIVFAAFAFGVFSMLERFGRVTAVVAVLTITVLVAATAELIQSTRGNEPDAADIVRDLAGAALVIAAWLFWRAGRAAQRTDTMRKIYSAAAVTAVAAIFLPLLFWILVAALNYYSAPRLVSFDRWWEPHTVWEVNTAVERRPFNDESFESNGQAASFALSPDRRSGISIFPQYADWSRYEYLAFTTAVVNGPDLNLSLRINDGDRFRQYGGSFTHAVPVTGTPTRIRLELHDLAKDSQAGTMDLTNIQQVTILAPRGSTSTTVIFDEIALE